MTAGVTTMEIIGDGTNIMVDMATAGIRATCIIMTMIGGTLTTLMAATPTDTVATPATWCVIMTAMTAGRCH